MALITTIGAATADSYGALADFQTYASNVGWTLTKTDTEQEADLRRSALYLDRNFNWKDYTVDAIQARQWPRNIQGLVDGWAVSNASIPQAIIDAQFELAWIAHGGTDLFATAATGAVMESKVKVDVIEETLKYKSPREHPLFTSITGLVQPYHNGTKIGGGGGFGSIDMVR